MNRRLEAASNMLAMQFNRLGCYGLHFQNFRVLRFGFRRCEKDVGQRIALALLKFAYPNQHDLLFAYEYT